MYVLPLVIVSVAVFATARSEKKTQEEKWEIFDKCKKQEGIEHEFLKKGWKVENFWCAQESTQKMSKCFMLEFGALNDDGFNMDVINEEFEGNDEERQKLEKCIKEAQEVEKEHQSCSLFDCCKREKIGRGGKKGKRERRSIFFV